MSDPLKPSPSLLSKLGSVIVHLDELYSKDGHVFDRHALDTVVNDPEVVAWRKQMDELAMLPRKRS